MPVYEYHAVLQHREKEEQHNENFFIMSNHINLCLSYIDVGQDNTQELLPSGGYGLNPVPKKLSWVNVRCNLMKSYSCPSTLCLHPRR